MEIAGWIYMKWPKSKQSNPCSVGLKCFMTNRSNGDDSVTLISHGIQMYVCKVFWWDQATSFMKSHNWIKERFLIKYNKCISVLIYKTIQTCTPHYISTCTATHMRVLNTHSKIHVLGTLYFSLHKSSASTCRWPCNQGVAITSGWWQWYAILFFSAHHVISSEVSAWVGGVSPDDAEILYINTKATCFPF